MKTSFFKKTLSIIFVLAMILSCASIIALPASAASYPSIFLETEFWGTDADLYAGDYISLKFTYFPAYKNEKISIYIYDSDDNLVASCDDQFSNYTIKTIDYTLNWDTKDYDPGQYTMVIEKYFYSYLEWRRTPTDTKYWITLKDPSNKPSEGWNKVNGYWMYYANGVKVTESWVKDSNGWCYLDANGYMVTNRWIKDSAGWCYVGANGYCLTNSWVKDSKGWCYLDANGRLTSNAWIKDNGKWYYLGNDSYLVTNRWLKDSIGWVFVGADGAMLTNQWVLDSNGWCYVGANGYAVTSCWKKDSKGWCYLNANGNLVTNQWLYDCGVWYYLDSNGYMVTGTVAIGGRNYTFNNSGVWVG